MKKYVVGVDAPVLASVKIAKNAQLAAVIWDKVYNCKDIVNNLNWLND